MFSSVLQVRFTLGNFCENELKSWRNQEFGGKVEADRELGLMVIAIKLSQRVLKIQRLASNIDSDREQVKSAISDFEADCDQGHLLIAIKVGKN